jgi:hypothetical protein
MRRRITMTEAVDSKLSIFLAERDNEEHIAKLTEATYQQLTQEIHEFRSRVAFGQDATKAFAKEVEEYGEDVYPPVALAIRKLGHAQLESDKKWLATLEATTAEFFPAEATNHD